MSKILITGNGFDLFHHLPTKYHHFISIMLTIEDIQYDTEVSFDELFGRVFKKRHLFEYNLIEEKYNSDNIKFNLKKIDIIEQFLQTNLWYKHFKVVSKINTWIDFEMEIETILNLLAMFDNLKSKKAIEKNMFENPLIIYSAFESFGIVKLDSNLGGFIINDEFINKRNGSIDVKKILEGLAKSFEGFIVIFNRYLVDIVSVFYAEIKQKELMPFQLMDEIYTFNYTPTLENFYNVEKSKIVYLHGKINEEDYIQNLILGVSEISNNIQVNKIYNFKKNYQKIKKATNNKFIYLPKNEVIAESQFFYLIGHSLDKSDKNYILDLFEYLKIDNTKLSEIIIFYYDQEDYKNKLNNLFSIVEEQILVALHQDNRLRFVELNFETILSEFNKPICDRYAEM